ncbi:MAG: protein-glutamate O-methyltransferase CheR [Planctomycetota bacterium]
MEERDFDYVRGVVREHAAIVVDKGKEYLVESRLGPLARELKFASIGELTEKLRGGDLSLRARVIEAMTTNETSFFRDRSPFDAMRDVIVPELLKAREAERSLHIWCGASSTGQEPYTLAMLLLDSFPMLSEWKFSILATDLSEEVLAKAKSGLFTQLEVNRGLPANYLARYFAKEDTSWRLQSSVRDRVSFRQMNLASAWPTLPKADVVFMRNVLIYFDVQVKKQILGGVHKLLRPDGFMFLGAAETTLGVTDQFVRKTMGKSVCYRPK